LRALLICPDESMRAQTLESLGELPEIVVAEGVLPDYPNPAELIRTVRSQSPNVILLSFEQVELALTVMKYLEMEAEGLPVIGLHQICNSETLRAGMRVGVREFVDPPFSASSLREALENVRDLVERDPVTYGAAGQIFSFLPSKPGVGTTTLALNISYALTRVPNTRVLLTDLDLCNGLIRFLLKLPKEVSIVDAMLRSPEMDLNMWPQLIVKRDRVDILHSGSANPQTYLDPGHIQHLLDFARRNYEALCFDLSGNMEQHSIRVMEDSRRIFLVCTPEVASLQLAKERLNYLESIGLSKRVGILLSRADQKMAIPRKKVEDLMEVPVVGVFSNAYRDVTLATGAASWVSPASRLGRECARFAEFLMGRAQAELSPAPATKGFLDRLKGSAQPSNPMVQKPSAAWRTSLAPGGGQPNRPGQD
jgi:pilus assembly protein CpaE